ncbi:biliverdin-producing heme oxygenase [Leptospira sp. 2 VSF19]|uniref:Biliverdin-producing heme oxygenase n=1 Tax=Leptospira soteropolitanensis TaxID=2950025 RepID=A0AAW5VQM5_9LEPT|nr:biliverdin-producing heme oxygenase [Leptospira soteropolitanensis]MCW7494343.1 biliverdin-producing heme oxygenase [Leptospira soteropolitanensis]MCW7501948.1 biliverdin-producing heme oxygenase [Leptospira soteropolitanensis]MCW7524189.1 biliverdin-producing heme oxygenase [Leptospira soteropolitanensis]MCW7528054.1 biliverdin-producing heme oxygenase [Leptospira soteropolitanensis]MCW7531908.1 biliverdin-producing heme oxygenase [Leptospira soteropolitanensis]
MSIAMMLREGTAEKHQETEKVPYLRAIFRGGLDAQTYTYQLESLLAVYTVMEDLYRQNKDNPILTKLYFPALFRENALKEDIASFQKKFGTKLRGSVSKATQGYIDHIKNIAKTKPELLVAQAYVRYLGDLSGGQAIKKVVAKTFALEGNEGTAFYEFPEIEDLMAFKGIYRQNLDTLPLDDTQKAELLEEAKATFDLNKFLFIELDSDLKENIGMDRYQTLLPAG